MLSIFCGAFVGLIVFTALAERSLLLGFIIAILVFLGVVYVIGFKLARKTFATVKIILNNNFITIYKHGDKKDLIEISNINQAVLIENTVHYPNHKFGTPNSYIHRYVILSFKTGSDYQILLDGFRPVWVESLLTYISRHNPIISLHRKKLVDGKPTC